MHLTQLNGIPHFVLLVKPKTDRKSQRGGEDVASVSENVDVKT